MLPDISYYVGPGSPNPSYPALNTAGGDWTPARDFMAADVHSNTVGAGGDEGYVQCPAGKGYFTAPMTLPNIGLKGTTPWHTVITGQLINVSGLVNLLIENLSVFSATDPIQITSGVDNGGRNRIIRNVEFHNISGTAIKITGSDVPYVKVRDCDFDLAANATAYRHDGYTDAGLVEDCNFFAYKIGMKIDGGAQRFSAQKNNFMHVGSSGDPSAAPRYDAWIAPSTSSVNDGVGVTFANYHGNEGRSASPADYFYVIADDNGSGLPNLTTASSGYLEGTEIRCLGGFWPNAAIPFIFSTTDNLTDNEFGRSSRRYVPTAAISTGSPTLQLLSTNKPSTTNRIYQILDRYTTAAGIAASLTALRTDFINDPGGTDLADPRKNLFAAWMNQVGTNINALMAAAQTL